MDAKINPALASLKVPLASLHLDPKNARKHAKRDLEVIAASLALHGQQKPIVALADGKVIAGNGTLEAARALGWDGLAVVKYDSEDAAKAAAFAIVDNRSAELSTWDVDALLAHLRVDSDHESIGFSEEDMRGLIESVTPARAEEWAAAAASLTSDRGSLRKMTFTLSARQQAIIVDAMARVEPDTDADSDNRNGCRLAAVAERSMR